jgi:hypothetical protein
MKIILSVLTFLFSLSGFGAVELYTPTEALRDINSGKLKFLGRALFPGNDQNKTCVYKSDRAYILYNNCLASKKESSATDIEVYAFEGRVFTFYIENKTSESAPSTLTRADYDMSWKIFSNQAPSMVEMNLKQLMDYKEALPFLGCGMGKTFEAQNMNSQSYCFRGFENVEGLQELVDFWREPGESWYLTLKYLRKVVLETKF